MRNIRRTVIYTACIGQRLNALGKFEEVAEVLEGKWTREKAQAWLRRKNKDDTITVAYVEQHAVRLKLSGEDFLKYAVEESID